MNTRKRAVPRNLANRSDHLPKDSGSYEGFKVLRASRGNSSEFLLIFLAMVSLTHFLALKILLGANSQVVNDRVHHQQLQHLINAHLSQQLELPASYN